MGYSPREDTGMSKLDELFKKLPRDITESYGGKPVTFQCQIIAAGEDWVISYWHSDDMDTAAFGHGETLESALESVLEDLEFKDLL
jgi:hypothetical protein